MRYFALAVDYDGTLAADGAVSEATIACLERFRLSGRKVLLVTGRELDDLLHIFPGVTVCDAVVAENGAVGYEPSTREQELLAEPASDTFVEALKERSVEPLAKGKSIVATTEAHKTTVLDTIQALGLELQVIQQRCGYGAAKRHQQGIGAPRCASPPQALST